MRGIVDHERFRVDALEQMGGRDVSEVERRILPQQDHIEVRQLGPFCLAQGEMGAGLVAHVQRLHRREDLVAALGELVGGVIGQPVPPLLRLDQEGESRIAADIDPLDRVHLHGDIQRHGRPSFSA